MTTDEVIENLRSVDLFRDVNDRELRKIAQRGRVISHGDGREITTEQGEAVGFHLVLSGSATVRRKGQDLRTLKPGDYFGEVSLIDGKPRSASIVAGEGLRTFALMSIEFRPLLEERPEIALSLLNVLCTRLRDAEARGDS